MMGVRRVHRGEAGERFGQLRAAGEEVAAALWRGADGAEALWWVGASGEVRRRVALPTPGRWSLPEPLELGEARVVVAGYGRAGEGGVWLMRPSGAVEGWAAVALPSAAEFFIVRGALLWLLCAGHVVCVELKAKGGRLGWPAAEAPRVMEASERNPRWWAREAFGEGTLAVAGASTFDKARSHYRAAQVYTFDLSLQQEPLCNDWDMETSGTGVWAHGAYWRPSAAGLWRAFPGAAPERVEEQGGYAVAATPEGVLYSGWRDLVLLDRDGARRGRLEGTAAFQLFAAPGCVLGVMAERLVAVEVDEASGQPGVAWSAACRGAFTHTVATLEDGTVGLCLGSLLVIQAEGAPLRTLQLPTMARVVGAGGRFVVHPDLMASVPPPADYNSYTATSSEPPEVAASRRRAFEEVAVIVAVDRLGRRLGELPAYPPEVAPAPGGVGLRDCLLYASTHHPGDLYIWAL